MSRRSFILFFKAMCSAQIASAADFATTLFLVNLCGLYYVSATFLGALMGGVCQLLHQLQVGLLRVVVEESYRSQIPDGVGGAAYSLIPVVLISLPKA